MKLSTRSRYGVRMMYELARRGGKEPVILKDIAHTQDISEKYLSKLVIPLKGAKLLRSSRGSNGGYTLTRKPSDISIREIVEVLENDLTSAECVNNDDLCERSPACPVREIWCGLDKSILEYLESISLDDILLRETGKKT